MSDIDEGGELSPEAKAFLSRHDATGEPTKAELDRVQQKLAAPVAAPVSAAKVLPLRRKRPLVPPEVLAAAAVVTLLLGAQGAYLLLRTPPEPAKDVTGTNEVKAIAAAWSAGDFAQVQRLASRECASAECRPLANELNTMLDRARRLEALTPEERQQLLQFDHKLSEGKGTVLSQKLSVAQAPATPAEQLALGEALFKEGLALKKEKNFEQATLRLQKCVTDAPTYHPCYRMLGSVYAAIAMRDQSAADMERARAMYEQFLEVAPPGDEYVPKVTAILEAARDDSAFAPPGVSQLPKVTLLPGQTMTLTIPGLQRVAVGDASTIDVKTIGGNKLELTGTAPGQTTLLAWGANDVRFSADVEVLGTTPSPAEDVVEVTVQVGGQQLVSFGPNLSRIAVGDPEIADVSVAGTQVRLKGLHAGKTTVLAWLASGQRKSLTVSVVGADTSPMAKLVQQASKARDSGDWPRAVELARQVPKGDAHSAAALRVLEDAREHAREIYLRAYQLKDSNPEEARDLFNAVMALTPPDDDLHQKAKARLSTLTP